MSKSGRGELIYEVAKIGRHAADDQRGEIQPLRAPTAQRHDGQRVTKRVGH
jgi:hypothetical protein